MIQQHSSSRRAGPRRYLIPTHLNVEDKIISFNGFGVTTRQAFLLLVGWSTAFNIWRHLDGLAGHGVLSLLLRIFIAAIPGILSLIVAMTTVAGRPLESWLAIVFRYHTLPKVYLWRSLSSREVVSSESEQNRRKRVPSHKKHTPQVPFDLEDDELE